MDVIGEVSAVAAVEKIPNPFGRALIDADGAVPTESTIFVGLLDGTAWFARRVDAALSTTMRHAPLSAGQREIAQLADTVTSQGIFAIVHDTAARLEDLPSGSRLVVICAQVRDPGNAGTVIRCADAFGADLVILTKGSVEVFNPKTVRASVGSIFHLGDVSRHPVKLGKNNVA